MKSSSRRQWLPPLIGILIASGVFAFFNSQLLASKLDYFKKSDNITDSKVINASKTLPDPSKPSRILIDKIGVDVPIVYGQAEINEKSFQLALRDGVVHYPYTAKPGESGKVVLFGHSSGAMWRPGNYKTAFSRLTELSEGDALTVEYQGATYTYRVKKNHIVLPTEVSVLYPSDRPGLTLITCYPIGTNEKRLIIEAEQTSPLTTVQTLSNPTDKSSSTISYLPAFSTKTSQISPPWETN